MFLASPTDPTTTLGLSSSSPSFFSSDFSSSFLSSLFLSSLFSPSFLSSFLSSLVSFSLAFASVSRVEALDPPSGSFPDFVELPASFLERERNEGQQRGIVGG